MALQLHGVEHTPSPQHEFTVPNKQLEELLHFRGAGVGGGVEASRLVVVLAAPKREVVAASLLLVSCVGVLGVGLPSRDTIATSATTARAAARARATASGSELSEH